MPSFFLTAVSFICWQLFFLVTAVTFWLKFVSCFDIFSWQLSLIFYTCDWCWQISPTVVAVNFLWQLTLFWEVSVFGDSCHWFDTCVLFQLSLTLTVVTFLWQLSSCFFLNCHFFWQLSLLYPSFSIGSNFQYLVLDPIPIKLHSIKNPPQVKTKVSLGS